MESTCSSKRAGLVAGVLGAILVCGVAVAFYFIGASSSGCEQEIVPTRNPIYFNSSTSYTSPLRTINDGRLPRYIEPTLYRIEMFPFIYGSDPNKFYFTGSMEMAFVCKRGVRTITMNVNKLNITQESVYVLSEDKVAMNVLLFEIDTTWQFLIIHLDEILTVGGKYVVGMNFTGPLKTDYTGLYLSFFQHRTINKYVAATQFSPTDARKAFPCLDEPDFKAEFDITIVRRDDMISLSNMPKVTSLQRGPRFVADVYERTPRMPTYLVAMVVGDFVSKTRLARPNLNYTSWAGAQSINKTENVLEFGAKVLAFFEGYFLSTFPLPKQDMLAVPETAVGAMENWGLIIFHEKNIIYEAGEYSFINLREATKTTSHELAHQWFGNLVTQDWWSNLFLKEGFAVYFADLGINHVYPEWNILDHFAAINMHRVFKSDGLVTSHPVHKYLKDVTEIRQVFDSISYTKGGCMIRMLHFVLGDDAFQAGLKQYIQKYQYGNVGFDDLWSEIEPKPLGYYDPPGVKAVMDTWILQKNYPVVTVEQIKPGYLRFRQERFLNNPNEAVSDKEVSPFGYIWKIPLTFTTSANPQFNASKRDIIWMEDKTLLLYDGELVDLYQAENWIVANIKQWGYYRVNYAEEIWINLINQLNRKHDVIHKVNRAQIINDLFSLSKAKMVPLNISLNVFNYLKNEKEYVPWIAASSQIRMIDKLMKNSPAHAHYRTVMKFILKPLYTYLQANKDNLTMEEHWLRSNIYALASLMELQTCLEDSQQTFEQWMRYGQRIDANIRSTAFCTALKNGSEADWHFVLNSYNTTTNINEKRDFLLALTCPKDILLINQLLELTKDTSTIKGRDVVTSMTWLAQNSDTDVVWNYVKQNWQYFLDRFSGGLFLLSGLVRGVTEPFTTEAQLKDLQKFISITPVLGTAKQAFNQAVEATRSNVEWLRDNQYIVEDWIQNSMNEIKNATTT